MGLNARIDWTFTAWALTALLIAVCYPAAKGIADPDLKRRYRRLQMLALLGAVAGAKLAVLFGDFGWPLRPLRGWEDVLYSGRSVMGGLLGGLLAAELGRWATGFPLPPNDRFAAVLPFSIAVGRVGCLLAGCCRGSEWHGPLAVAYDDAVLRHPAPLYEAAFHLGAGLLFLRLVRAGRLSGRVFSLYLVLYGIFRFGTEFLRETPKFHSGWSGYQYLALVMVAVGTGCLIARSPAPARGLESRRA